MRIYLLIMSENFHKNILIIKCIGFAYKIIFILKIL